MKSRLTVQTLASSRVSGACALACLLVGVAGCASVEGFLSGDRIDYKSQSSKTPTLEVPPDLTQLARDPRYQPQGGVVSASAVQAPAGAAAVAAVAPSGVADMRVERQGNQRWLVTTQTPEQLWPLVKAFWTERGFVMATESAEAGVMETDWAENRGKLPQDFLRRTLGPLLDPLFSTGERDKFRTRIERVAGGSEVYISHRGMEEVLQGQLKETTAWRNRPTDPQLEAEMLSRLMVRLGSKEEPARALVAKASDQPARARSLGAASAAMEVDESFDRAWRRVGLALDRSGFTVEDRDRNSGLYFVRYAASTPGGKEEPGFFARLFGSEKNAAAALQRYRIAVKAAGDKTQVSVQNAQGGADSGAVAQRIVGLLVDELK